MLLYHLYYTIDPRGLESLSLISVQRVLIFCKFSIINLRTNTHKKDWPKSVQLVPIAICCQPVLFNQQAFITCNHHLRLFSLKFILIFFSQMPRLIFCNAEIMLHSLSIYKIKPKTLGRFSLSLVQVFSFSLKRKTLPITIIINPATQVI